jgi:hypothetical protein
LAVKRVTQNRGKRTAGIDGVKWATLNSKMNAALILSDVKYKAKPLRRVYISKQGTTKKRPHKMCANMHIVALVGNTLQNGFWKGISRDVSIISTMTGF